jgi:hypothetical protein
MSSAILSISAGDSFKRGLFVVLKPSCEILLYWRLDEDPSETDLSESNCEDLVRYGLFGEAEANTSGLDGDHVLGEEQVGLMGAKTMGIDGSQVFW